MTTQPTEEQIILVDRLVEMDKEAKAMKRRIRQLECDLSSLKGSCQAMGRDLSIARRQKSQYLRSLQWLVFHLNVSLEGTPGWVLNTLKHVVKMADKKLEAH